MLEKIDVHSGEIGFTGNRFAVMTTVVGVCIALILWDRKQKRGGMCHYRLPVATDARDYINKYDFGSEAIITLLKRFKQAGSNASDLEARIIGGGDIHYGAYMENQSIGEQNVRVARALLNHFSIPLKGKIVGGPLGRQIKFEVGTGDVGYKEFDCEGNKEVQSVYSKDDPLFEEPPSSLEQRVDTFLHSLTEPEPEKDDSGLQLTTAESIDDFLETSRRRFHRSALIIIGASTGGVDALTTIIKGLPPVSPPICIVQHIPENFSTSLANNLNKLTMLTVTEAVNGVELEDSHVYVASGGKHMKVVQVKDNRLILRLTDDPPVNSFRPSVDYLFRSVLKIEHRKMVGVLLTGMGTDGAEGLLALRKKGVHTIAQNRDTSVVWGMAGEAVKIGAACRTAPLSAISQLIMDQLK